MLNVLPGAGSGVEARVAGSLPTRIITYAWGEKYLDLLLSLNLPALLAPGNLPYVAATTSCQVVILTEERLFPRVASHPAVAQIRTHCDLQMISLDDLIASPDKYGMALSFVLHRGFADLGPAMTDSWQIFLNADFILADGSLRALMPRLARGERIVAAPSYCVNSEAALAELRQRIDPHTLTLALPPREMAAMILRHRHNTIRGKTFSQHAMSMRYMDQFYWEADRSTLLGYQMPIAIVGLRPQQHVGEPNAYWDHGLMREFCPDAVPCVIGDSDEFLMLELRSEETAAEQISLGWPTAAEIASHMITFLTPYQREYLDYPLTLHAADLPADVEACRANLKARVEEVFAHVPQVLPSHINHPQWHYHLPGFTRSRHEALSKRLGRRTVQAAPPDTFSSVDQAWWRLDGLEKSQHRGRQNLVDAMERDLRWLDEAAAAMVGRHGRDAGSEEKALQELAALAAQAESRARSESAMALTLPRQGEGDSQLAPENLGALDAAVASVLGSLGPSTADIARLDNVRAFVKGHYERRLLLLDSDYEAAKRKLQAEYDRFMPRGVASAGIPHIEITTGPKAQPLTGSFPVRLARRLYHTYFGKVPRVTRLNPYWAPLRHVVRLVDEVAASGGSSVFLVSSQPSPVERLADGFTGKHARITPAIALSDTFSLAVTRARDFDLCLCVLDFAELAEFPRLVVALAPCMRPGGRIVAFHMNPQLAPLPASDPKLILALSRLPQGARVHYAGSQAAANALSAFQRAGAVGGGRLERGMQMALSILRLAPVAFAANRAEEKAPSGDVARPPAVCTSITLEATIFDRAPQP